MTRFKRLQDWPDCLTKMTQQELQAELRYWQARINSLGHPTAKNEAAKRVRTVQAEIDSRG
jgi:hypothetical protein